MQGFGTCFTREVGAGGGVSGRKQGSATSVGCGEVPGLQPSEQLVRAKGALEKGAVC